MPTQQNGQPRPLYKKLLHGVLGLVSGLLIGPLVALGNFRYLMLKLQEHSERLVHSAESNVVAILRGLAVGLTLVVVTFEAIFIYLPIYTLYAMARGLYVGFAYAVYGVNAMVALLISPAHSYISHTQEEASAGRSFLQRRFGMYNGEDTSKMLVMDWAFSSDPKERKIGVAFRYVVGSWHKFAAHDESGCSLAYEVIESIKYRHVYWHEVDVIVDCSMGLAREICGGRQVVGRHPVAVVDLFTSLLQSDKFAKPYQDGTYPDDTTYLHLKEIVTKLQGYTNIPKLVAAVDESLHHKAEMIETVSGLPKSCAELIISYKYGFFKCNEKVEVVAGGGVGLGMS